MKSVRKMFGSLMGKNKKKDVDVDCPICFEPLGNEPTIETPCKHKFHRRCLRTWCTTNFESRCPICRGNITETCNELNPEPTLRRQRPQPISFEEFTRLRGSRRPIREPIIAPTFTTYEDYIQRQGPTQIQEPIIMDSSEDFTRQMEEANDRSMRENNWTPLTYITWMRRGQPNADHVTILDVSELGDMLDGHTVQLDIERICNSFPNLRLLKLNGNNLTHIPACIGNLRNLEILDLANNNIPAVEVEVIFADPYWNDKSVSVKADNVTFDNNNLPYGFFISNNGSLRSNNRSTRSRVAPQNAGKKRRTRKYRRTKRRRSKRRK
jgi:hypothetical protein